MLQVEIVSVDVQEGENLSVSHCSGHSAQLANPQQLCKGDVFTSVFMVESSTVQRLVSMGGLVVKWRAARVSLLS